MNGLKKKRKLDKIDKLNRELELLEVEVDELVGKLSDVSDKIARKNLLAKIRQRKENATKLRNTIYLYVSNKDVKNC